MGLLRVKSLFRAIGCSNYHGSSLTSTCSFDSRSSPSFFPKKNQDLELVCDTLAFGGKGVCRISETGFVVMCDGALPGERFIGRINRKKRNYVEVKKVKSRSPHWNSVPAPCEYALNCGGCKMQNLAYEAQLKAKEQQVRDLMIHIGKFSSKELAFSSILKSIIPCEIQFGYRNKMEFSFGTRRWIPGDFISGEQDRDEHSNALGLHAPGCFDKVLNIDKCLLQTDPANKVLRIVQAAWRDSCAHLSPYDVHTHSGFLKHLILRTGRDAETGQVELMINFVTTSHRPELLKPLVDRMSILPEVVSIVNNINRSVSDASYAEDEYILHGRSSITEILCGLTFQISANSFFQTNTHQAEVLYKQIHDLACLSSDGSEIVLDLFCGVGTIGLSLAKRVKHVYGVEIIEQAIQDACFSAQLNDIKNATFIQGDLSKIDNLVCNIPLPDIVITDPNRPGMHAKLIKFLLKLQAPRIIYISCNPATCARDLNFLCHGVALKRCYQLKCVQPVDMFPHTPHIECVCLLELCDHSAD